MSDDELSRAREEIGRLTALHESDEWIIQQGAETISNLEAKLAAAHALISKTYPQFPDVEDCDERLRRLEASKDARISQQTVRIQHLEEAVRRQTARAEVRKEVHRDDYLRSGFLIAALKQIIALGNVRSTQIAEQALVEVYGVTQPTGHCPEHSSYRPNCPNCVAIGQPAYGTSGGVSQTRTGEEE